MKTSKTTVEQWEAAWEEYIEALAASDQTRPLEFRRGHKMSHNNNKMRARRAARRLRKLDPEFCQRNDI